MSGLCFTRSRTNTRIRSQPETTCKIEVACYKQGKIRKSPGDSPQSSSKVINQSASRSMQNFGGQFHVRNLLTTCIIFFDLCKRFIRSWQIGICYYKVMKEAEEYFVIFILDHVQKYVYFYLRQRLLTMKAFRQILDWSEPGRLRTLSSCFHSLSQHVSRNQLNSSRSWPFINRSPRHLICSQFIHGQGLFSLHLSTSSSLPTYVKVMNVQPTGRPNRHDNLFDFKGLSSWLD